MGLIGMARWAGRAHGAYLANMEAYRRNRQDMFDDMARQRFDMDRTAFAGNQAWLAKSRARQEKAWGQADEDRTNFLLPARRMSLELYQMKKDALGRLPEAKQDRYLLYGSKDPTLRNFGKTGKTGTGQQEFSDTRVENTAKNISPALVKSAFIREFEADDKDIQRRTGKFFGNAIKPEEYYNSLAAEYAHHVRTAGGNALPLDEFVLRKGMEHGFRSRWDMGKYFQAKNGDKGSPTLRKWLTNPVVKTLIPYANANLWHNQLVDRFTRSAEEQYAAKNPTAYSMQKQIENELTATLGKNAIPFMQDPALVRAYYVGRRRKKMNPATAADYAYSVQSGGAR